MHLLLSARDPAAGRQMAGLSRAVEARNGVTAELHAMEPALGIIEADRPALVVRAVRSGGEDLIGTARDLLRRAAPDAVIVGLSNPDHGIDEALLAVAGELPTFAIQDFWGDTNRALGALPDAYFVRDELAARITLEATGVPAIATGLPQYEAYAAFDAVARRAEVRAALGLRDTDELIGLFTQPLWSVEGYAEALASVLDAALRRSPRPALYVGAHPKDQQADARIRRLCDRAGADGLRLVETIPGPVESALVACDVVATAYSMTGCDMLALSRAAAKPINTVLYLLPPAVAGYFRESTGLARLPVAEAGLAPVHDATNPMDEDLDRALRPGLRDALWRRAGEWLPDPKGAADRILDAIAAEIGRPVRASGVR